MEHLAGTKLLGVEVLIQVRDVLVVHALVVRLLRDVHNGLGPRVQACTAMAVWGFVAGSWPDGGGRALGGASAARVLTRGARVFARLALAATCSRASLTQRASGRVHNGARGDAGPTASSPEQHARTR